MDLDLGKKAGGRGVGGGTSLYKGPFHDDFYFARPGYPPTLWSQASQQQSSAVFPQRQV